MAKFQVLRGIHAQRDGPKDEAGRRKVTTYLAATNPDGSPAGDIVESDADLAKNHNKAGRPKFARIPEVVPINSVVGPKNDDLSTKTLAELRALAEEQQIDLGEATLKADVLETIRSELNAVGA